jgi:hypothetical protein
VEAAVVAVEAVVVVVEAAVVEVVVVRERPDSSMREGPHPVRSRSTY